MFLGGFAGQGERKIEVGVGVREGAVTRAQGRVKNPGEKVGMLAKNLNEKFSYRSYSRGAKKFSG
jgi:hypothetical protein